FAQFLEPVIIGNRFGQFPARPIDAGVKTAPPIAPQGTERHFNGRDRARPDCQYINQIDQDPARRPKALRDVVTKIFYTRLRGAVCFFCHAPSVTLDARLVGEAWPPRFLTKLVLRRGEVNLDAPATTLALLKLNAVVGVKGTFNPDGTLQSMGISCAFCHSTVNDSLAPGIGRRLDGW